MLHGFFRAALLATALFCTSGAEAQKSFIGEDLASEGVRLEERLRIEGRATAAGRSAAHLRGEAQAHIGRGENRQALPLLTAAIPLEPRNAAGWLAFARRGQWH
jgi:hypothetical protein